MGKINAFRLAYADFCTTDVQKMVEYYTNVMGYKVTDTEDGIFYLTNGLDHHNIVITPGNSNYIKSYGYQLDGSLSISEVQEELTQQNIESKKYINKKPGIEEHIELNDPAGNTVEIFNKMDYTDIGFGNQGIQPLKLGHIAFYAKNHKETAEFYQDILGFTFTDKIDENFCYFLTCNNDHHVINIVASNETKLHHIAFQLKDASHQYASSDTLRIHNHPVLWGPSRHTAGHNIATYHHDPARNVIELYIDMDVYIPELGIFEPRLWHETLPLQPRIWYSLSAWGTEFQVDLAKV